MEELALIGRLFWKNGIEYRVEGVNRRGEVFVKPVNYEGKGQPPIGVLTLEEVGLKVRKEE